MKLALRDRWAGARLLLAAFLHGQAQGKLQAAIDRGEDRFKDYVRVVVRFEGLRRRAEKAGYDPDKFVQMLERRP